MRYDGDSGSGHVLVFAGSGGYKTRGTVVPSALEWKSGLVCLDPSAEVFRLAHRARREMGRRVVSLDPESPYASSFNVLDWIDTSSDRALLDLQSVVAWLAGETPGERHEDYFKHAARALLGCLLADLIFDPVIRPSARRSPCSGIECLVRFLSSSNCSRRFMQKVQATGSDFPSNSLVI